MIDLRIVKSREAEARRNGSKALRKYSTADEVFFARLVRDGMPKWKVCRDYKLPRSSLHNMIKRHDPESLRRQVRNKQRKIRAKAKLGVPQGPGRSNFCPVCAPMSLPEECWDRAERRAWGQEQYTPRAELRHTTNGNGQAYGYCPKCGYREESLAA